MSVTEILNTGRSGMMAAKSAIATSGHNISNANTEGYNRQRVEIESAPPYSKDGTHGFIGRGVKVNTVSRINDEYLEKQIRNVGTQLASTEEKDLIFKNIEDVFNEMNGDGLNRLMGKFFNEFRQLANDPSSTAIRQSVMESTQSLINDFTRIRSELKSTENHIDSRITNYVTEVNSLGKQIRDLNIEISKLEVTGGSPNDLKDKRDLALKKLSEIIDISTYKDKQGAITIDMKGAGPLVSGPNVETLSVKRTEANKSEGKSDNGVDIMSSGSGGDTITHLIQGGRLQGLVEVRDKTISSMVEKLDELAYTLIKRVNQIHTQGVSRTGERGIQFFNDVDRKEGASEALRVNKRIAEDARNIAAAFYDDSPGDNRVALTIAGLQNLKLLNDGNTSFDDHYNSIVTEVGVDTARNRENYNQQKNIFSQLGNIREQVSGVSIDEETANLMQFHHVFGATAKVISIADDMLKTVLNLRP